MQHGILDKDVSSVYGKSVSDIDLFVTTTKLEAKFVVEKFGYKDDEVANVGISRYDKLVSYKNKCSILQTICKAFEILAVLISAAAFCLSSAGAS